MYKKSYRVCKYCGKDIVSTRHGDHERKCLVLQEKANREKKSVGRPKGIPAWNKGMTKHTNAIVASSAKTNSMRLKKLVESGEYTPIVNSQEWKQQTSFRQSTKNSGGRCKWYDVDGVYVQGTWEYNVALKLNADNINWIKVKTKEHVLQYIKDGKIKTYCPDFYLPELDLYLEIKGYWWGDDKEKMRLVIEQHPNINIFIMQKQEYDNFLSGKLDLKNISGKG